MFERSVDFAALAVKMVNNAVPHMRGKPANLPVLAGTPGWTAPMKKVSLEIAKHVHGMKPEDLAFGAIRAWQRGWLRDPPDTIRYSSDCLVLRTCVAIAIRALREWQSERQPNELPPKEYAALYLVRNWGTPIAENTVGKIASRLACVFPAGSLPTNEVETLIGGYAPQTLSAKLGIRIAIDALRRAAELRALAPPTSPDEIASPPASSLEGNSNKGPTE